MGLQQSKDELVYQQVSYGNAEGIKALCREGAGLEVLLLITLFSPPNQSLFFFFFFFFSFFNFEFSWFSKYEWFAIAVD